MDFSIHSNPRTTTYPEPPTQVEGPDTRISKTNQDSGSNGFACEVFYQEEKIIRYKELYYFLVF
jgi:hypothetical protein